MKKAVILFIFTTTLHAAGLAQNINGVHQPKADGHIKKVGITSPTTKLTGQNVVWDFSNLEVSDNEYLVDYISTDTADNIIAGIERRTRFYYHTSNDSVLLCGYENNQNKVIYDKPQLFLRMPLSYNQQNEGFFHGTSAFCEKLFMRVFGSYTVKVDGVGSMILPSGDTLRHVSRVHIQQHTVKSHYPNITTEEELRFFVDSIAPFTDDSIRYKLAKDSIMKVTNIYRWYAAGYRYPIIECINVSPKNSEAYKTDAYYCSPDEQEHIEDEENEQIRLLLTAIDTCSDKWENSDNRINQDFSSNQQNTSTLQNVSIAVNGMTLTIRYDLMVDANVNALVCDISGIVYRQGSLSGTAGESKMSSINCSGLRRGQYVLFLNVDGQIYSYTISL